MNTSDKKDRSETHEEHQSMKGALVSVLLIGGFIALLWFAIWGIYMVRL